MILTRIEKCLLITAINTKIEQIKTLTTDLKNYCKAYGINREETTSEITKLEFSAMQYAAFKNKIERSMK
jgi:hypothetical protein